MGGTKKDKNSKFTNLRAAAEKAIEMQNSAGHEIDGKDINAIFQELQLHQVELEMQNDELSIANEELELERLKFASLFDLAPAGYFILNYAGFVEEINVAGLQMLEVSPRKILKKRLSAFVAPNETQNFYTFFQNLTASNDRQRMQIEMISASGRRFFAQLEGSAIGRMSQCYITLVDIDETIAGRKILADTNNRLEMALQAATAGTWTLDLATMVLELDEYSYGVCHIDPNAYDKQYSTFLNLIHPDNRFMADQQFRQGINGLKDIDIICRILTVPDQEIYLSIRGHLPAEKDAGKLVGILWDITEKKRTEEVAEQLRIENQKKISTITLQTEERERKRISEALHDSVSQLLYGIRIHLSQLNNTNLEKGSLHLNKLIDMAIAETRNISFELAPPILEHFGLPDTIKELVSRLQTPQLQFKLKLLGFSQRFDLLLEHTVFRIIQELVNNSLKHSGGNLIEIQLRKNHQIEIIVQDNGIGFNTADFKTKPGGAGLVSIENRVNLYNGEMEIQSEIERGTRIRITLNYDRT